MQPQATQDGGVEDVFGDRGQVDLFGTVRPRSLRARMRQRADEVLGMIHRDADVGRHVAQVVGRAVRVARHDVDRRAHDRERRAQFMRGVGDELPLTLERGLEPAEHLVECLGQFAEFVAGTTQSDPGRQVVFRRGTGGRGDSVHRAQDAPGEDPSRGSRRGR